MVAGISAATMNAQQMRSVQGSIDSYSPTFHKNVSGAVIHGSYKTTTGGSRWYNAAENTGEYNNVNIYSSTLANFSYLWPDSSVRYPSPNNGFGINYLSIGNVFHPQSILFNDGGLTSNVGKIAVTSTNAYTIDSFEITGFYSHLSTASYVDTLIFTFVPETTTRKYPYWSYGGSVFTDHNVDSFAAQLYNNSNYQVNPINQISYTVSGVGLGAAVVKKVAMNAALYADSNADGTHTIAVAPNISMPAGTMVDVSVTYKSMSGYTAGTTIDQYSHFLFLSHENVDGGFVKYVPGDLNMSSVVTKDTVNAGVNATLNMYIPAIAFTAPFGNELHNMAWKVSCPTCNLVSVTDIAGITVGEPYPNPTSETIAIPYNVKESSNVSISISNTLGQVVKTQNIGKLAAGQNGQATFNVADLNTGVYFCTIEANGQRATKRIVVTH